MWSFRFAFITVIAIATLLLTACPFPVPPHSLGTRMNIDHKVPAFVKEGVTIREDVIMSLGEPDAVSADKEIWVMYVSGRSGGGIGLIIAGGGNALVGAVEHSHYQRLIIKFDDRGIVVFATVDNKSCALWSGGALREGGGQSSPCLDIYGSDISKKYNW